MFPRKLIRLLFWFLLSASVCAQVASSPRSGSILLEYQKIVKETQKHRIVNLSTAVGEDESTVIDQFGFMWMYSKGKVYRFNGIRFQEEMMDFHPDERDALQSIVSIEGNQLFVIGKQSVYKWLGHKFERYAFHDSDQIVLAEKYEDRILCIGEKGYAIYGSTGQPYTSSSLRFHERSRRRFESDNRVRSSSFTRFALDSTNRVLSIDWIGTFRRNESGSNRVPTKWTNDLYLKITHGTRVDSMLVMTKSALNALENSRTTVNPRFVSSLDGSLYLYLKSSQHFFKIDSDKKTVTRLNLTSGFSVEHVFKGTSADWVMTSDSRKIHFNTLVGFLNNEEYSYSLDLGISEINGSRLTIYLDGVTTTYVYDYSSFMTKPQIVYSYNPDSQSLQRLRVPLLNTRVELRGNLRYVYGSESGHYLMFVAPNPRIANTHFAYMYDLQNQRLYSSSVADEASSLAILNANAEDRSVFLRGHTQYYKITFDELSHKIADFQDGFGFGEYDFYSAQADPLISAASQYYVSRNQTQKDLTFFLYQTGELKKLQTFRQASVVHHDPVNSQIYLWSKAHQDSMSLEPDEQYVLQYRYRDDEFKVLTKGLNTKSEVFFNDELIELMPRNYLVWKPNHQERPDTSYVYQAFAQTFGTLFRSHRISPEYLFSLLNYTFLGSDQVFFRPHDLQLDVGYYQTSLSELDPEQSSRLGICHELEITAGTRKILRIPGFILDLKEDKITFKPLWNRVIHSNRNAMVLHIEEQKGKYTARVSNYDSGDILTDPDDFTTRIDMQNIHLLSHFVQGNQYGVYYGSRLFFKAADTWLEIDLHQFELYGKHLQTLALNKVFWLVFDRAIVRYDIETNMAFAYDQKEGLPQVIRTAHLTQTGEVMIVGDGSIFKIRPKDNPPELVIPWVEVNGNRRAVSELEALNFWENNVSIPIEVLKMLYPESCVIEYRLKGFDNEWRRRPYTESLDYDKLRPGKYLLEIKVYAPDGGSSELKSIEIKISPPIYLAWWAYLIYAALSLFVLWILYRWRVRKYRKHQIFLENEVSKRTLEIRERTSRLNESITYAYAIQESMLPPSQDLAAGFKDFFILWKPRDRVGGDFYWYYKDPETNQKLIAVIDCTGHGVPGSMLSMMANTLLNNIVKDDKEMRLARILQQMHKEVFRALHQHADRGLNDGMDISIVSINEDTKTISFAGAGQHLIYFKDDDPDLKFVRGQRQGIGGSGNNDKTEYPEITFVYSSSVSLYLYTDGIVDQSRPDSKRGLRYGQQRWIGTINSLHRQSMETQKQILKDKLDLMINRAEQRDDITVIGLRI